ncbi:hypothetical protein B0J13DRAFT_505202 [Dactylonectria estremocensis]|uniref:AAA+ ATPase domain-containing protein n=1 Tax=Dactylonectria estremocensis TaxID=1079267 RepID=A0A9P9J2N0_9HYPO|nr:hypothetical protein B0J13DRAFT_505202 [Dactylonectria estremocensis]
MATAADASGLTTPPQEEEPLSPQPTSSTADARNLIKHSVEYFNRSSKERASVTGDVQNTESETESLVLEYVEVRETKDSINGNSSDQGQEKKYRESGQGHPYIRIISPAVNEALRCVVDYYPLIDFSVDVIEIYAPYAVFFFFEKQLTEYRQRLEEHESRHGISPTCANRFAAKHIAIAQSFVNEKYQAAVEAERERHARGFATFDMLWLLYKPGSDMYMDPNLHDEYEPFVLLSADFDMINGTTENYQVDCWNMDASSVWVAPSSFDYEVDRFAGEKEIISLRAYPCEYLRFTEGLAEQDLVEIKDHFTNRGKKWYSLRRKNACYSFDGVTVSAPRRNFLSYVMVDPDQYVTDGRQRSVLMKSVEHPSSPFKICSCESCEQLIYNHAVKPKFAGYSTINPLALEKLTDHQYFLCDNMVEAFVFKTRSWEHLHISGFQECTFDKTLFERLVMKESTKDLVKNLTRMYIRDNTGRSIQEEKPFNKISMVHKPSTSHKQTSTWSADFIQGKGEGLTFLLHGKPGVGKTYTAECIADFTERPLLSLTCSDIGVEPTTIEYNLLKWFKVAEKWGAIMLIDEADIYMEQRQVQDIERNHLVAGFLRALEYFKGILFLTTNRVGTFDEAFISRIQVQLYYPEFQDDDRDKVWDTFFQKLEEDRETTMRIPQATKDYTQSVELRALKWNGREIRNAFQVAVALAESQGHKDRQGRVLIKPDHLKATVQMSREFKDYLLKLHKQDPSKRAAMMGNRYDAYDSTAGSEAKKISEKY